MIAVALGACGKKKRNKLRPCSEFREGKCGGLPSDRLEAGRAAEGIGLSPIQPGSETMAGVGQFLEFLVK